MRQDTPLQRSGWVKSALKLTKAALKLTKLIRQRRTFNEGELSEISMTKWVKLVRQRHTWAALLGSPDHRMTSVISGRKRQIQASGATWIFFFGGTGARGLVDYFKNMSEKGSIHKKKISEKGSIHKKIYVRKRQHPPAAWMSHQWNTTTTTMYHHKLHHQRRKHTHTEK